MQILGKSHYGTTPSIIVPGLKTCVLCEFLAQRRDALSLTAVSRSCNGLLGSRLAARSTQILIKGVLKARI